MGRFFLFPILFFLVFAIPSASTCASLEDNIVTEKEPGIIGVVNSFIRTFRKPENSPDWLKRTNIQFQFREDYKPSYMLETVQPIHSFRHGKDILFTQINARTRGGDQTYNIGLGYRNISYGTVVLGVNAFYDYTTYYSHQRVGAGIEALGVDYEARANAYYKATGAKEIRSGITEEVMNGFDVEAGGNLIPWSFLYDLKLYAGYQYFNSDYADDIKYYNVRAVYPISKYLEIEGKMLKEENRDEKFILQITGGVDVASKRNPRANDRTELLKRKLLQPVEREHDIIIEQKNASSGGFSVSVKRGT